VYDVTEAQHEQITRRRRDPHALFAYLAEQRIVACLNHPFSPLTGQRAVEDLHLGFAGTTLLEARNGMLPAVTNDCARRAASLLGRGAVGGSDAHTLYTVARAYTTVPGARDKAEFLDGLRRGGTIPCGRAGSYALLTAEILRLAAGGVVEALRPRSAVLPGRRAGLMAALPLGLLVPLGTLVQTVKERVWSARMFARYRATLGDAASPAAAGRLEAEA
jgi:hypothetical protein